MDKRNSFEKIDITKNEEPTRFLSKEEMEQLEQAEFYRKNNLRNENKNNTACNLQEKNKHIQIEDIAVNKMKSKRQKRKFSSIKKFCKKAILVISFIIAGVLGFYLAFSWNMQDESEYNAKSHEVQQLELKEKQLIEKEQEIEEKKAQFEAEKVKLDKQHEDLTTEKSFFTQIMDKFTGKEDEDKVLEKDLEAKINEVQELLQDAENQLDNLQDMKNQVNDLKIEAQNKLEEHQSSINALKYQVELLIDKFLN